MKLLAFDTSTETLSIALSVTADGAPAKLWQHTGAGGAQASATLIASILQLLDQAGLQLAQLDAIAFGCGPGSFTGLRTACAVAQGLAFGAGLPLLPVDSLLAVAEQARHEAQAERVLAVLDARMDQVYAAHWAWQPAGGWQRDGDTSLTAPEALSLLPGEVMAGNAFASYGQRLPDGAQRVAALPDAAAMLRLAPALLAAGHAVPAELALPQYIRDKVAQTTQERADSAAAVQLQRTQA